jgi:hypothetical protein
MPRFDTSFNFCQNSRPKKPKAGRKPSKKKKPAGKRRGGFGGS